MSYTRTAILITNTKDLKDLNTSSDVTYEGEMPTEWQWICELPFADVESELEPVYQQLKPKVAIDGNTQEVDLVIEKMRTSFFCQQNGDTCMHGVPLADHEMMTITPGNRFLLQVYEQAHPGPLYVSCMNSEIQCADTEQKLGQLMYARLVTYWIKMRLFFYNLSCPDLTITQYGQLLSSNATADRQSFLKMSKQDAEEYRDYCLETFGQSPRFFHYKNHFTLVMPVETIYFSRFKLNGMMRLIQPEGHTFSFHHDRWYTKKTPIPLPDLTWCMLVFYGLEKTCRRWLPGCRAKSGYK